jgi:hypothetical protein
LKITYGEGQHCVLPLEFRQSESKAKHISPQNQGGRWRARYQTFLWQFGFSFQRRHISLYFRLQFTPQTNSTVNFSRTRKHTIYFQHNTSDKRKSFWQSTGLRSGCHRAQPRRGKQCASTTKQTDYPSLQENAQGLQRRSTQRIRGARKKSVPKFSLSDRINC